jgi:polygalacturonase
VNEQHAMSTVLNAGIPRRQFLRNSMLLALPIIVGGISLPAAATAYAPPLRTRGTTILSVKTYGAVGDGIHDDTAAFQAAINALPAAGGTVVVPAGTYLIDPLKKVNLRSYMLLSMDPNAVLKAKSNSAIRAYILYAYNKTQVEIAGGQLVGDRDTHTYITTSTSEWNHGIQILASSHVTIRDLRVSKCAGDGVCLGGGATDVVIANIVSTGNRRQGLSITESNNIKVFDSEFSYTKGTSPECGIDIEPDGTSIASDIWIENCRLNNNSKYGINVYKRATRVTLNACTVESNGSCGVVTVGCSFVTVQNCLVQNNSATGVQFYSGSNLVLQNGVSYNNYNRLGSKDRVDFSYTGYKSTLSRDMLIKSTATNVTIGTNLYK